MEEKKFTDFYILLPVASNKKTEGDSLWSSQDQSFPPLYLKKQQAAPYAIMQVTPFLSFFLKREARVRFIIPASTDLPVFRYKNTIKTNINKIKNLKLWQRQQVE